MFPLQCSGSPFLFGQSPNFHTRSLDEAVTSTSLIICQHTGSNFELLDYSALKQHENMWTICTDREFWVLRTSFLSSQLNLHSQPTPHVFMPVMLFFDMASWCLSPCLQWSPHFRDHRYLLNGSFITDDHSRRVSPPHSIRSQICSTPRTTNQHKFPIPFSSMASDLPNKPCKPELRFLGVKVLSLLGR